MEASLEPNLIAFLDLTESDKPREEIRRMEKNIKKNKYYLGKNGRVFFFRFESEERKKGFFIQILDGIHKAKDRAIIVEERHDLNKVIK